MQCCPKRADTGPAQAIIAAACDALPEFWPAVVCCLGLQVILNSRISTCHSMGYHADIYA